MQRNFRITSFYGKMSILSLLTVFILIQSVSCKKYLDKKPVKNLYVPASLKDLQALLDNSFSINYGRTPSFLEMVADNYFIDASNYDFAGVSERTNYIWKKDAEPFPEDYQLPYSGPIYYSNVVLKILENISKNGSNEFEHNSIRGYALFYRAFAFYQLAQLYSPPFTNNANTDKGIVLRTTADIGEPVVRSTVFESYKQIINGLKEAADLLPSKTLYPSRPNRAAAFGLLARVYLSMRDYTNAEIYSNLSLEENDALLNFNDLPFLYDYSPFYGGLNPEINYSSSTLSSFLLAQGIAYIDTMLLASFDDNDLRKSVYFYPVEGSKYSFKGSYHGFDPSSVFDGIATDEIYLIRAECNARKNNISAALNDLNNLLQSRWMNNGTWVSYNKTDQTEVLNKVLEERRKELVFRGLRWSDLRRLNLEGKNITLRRVVNSETFTLPPNDLRWILLIPFEEITRAGIQQNPR